MLHTVYIFNRQDRQTRNNMKKFMFSVIYQVPSDSPGPILSFELDGMVVNRFQSVRIYFFEEKLKME